MISQNSKNITVVMVQDINHYPPVRTLVKILLNHGYKVNLLGNNLSKFAEEVKDKPDCNLTELADVPFASNNRICRLIRQVHVCVMARKKLKQVANRTDILWTASSKTIAALGKVVLRYKHIMQLMELEKTVRLLKGFGKFDLRKPAKHAWKIVVPEINRAYIQQIWWDLPQKTYILPNKPYDLDYGKVDFATEKALGRMKAENRKIILYLGIIARDRELISLANAIAKSSDYVFYFAGRYVEGFNIEDIERAGGVYLGMFSPPQHLALLDYAYIGLLPYLPDKSARYTSELNALYCAPNKIWEYAGFGVPMVGSDVMGLKLPFEQWNIGKCCNPNDASSIIEAINYVDTHHDEMSCNCRRFFDSVDLDRIVSEILED